ncbi:MAG: hypothetical protein FJ272_10260 [Planctomycetes bacterium]|nr:hypothetical protein [Planctomycetota bacterium]
MTNAEGLIATRLCRVLAVHFDPQGGSPYWLEKAAALDGDPRETIRSLDDLSRLGPMDEAALASRPVEDFVPRSLWSRRTEFLVAETGGTLGRPKYAVHRADEFEAAFVQPFVVAANKMGFPRGENWLFVGPTGPHIIGKAARACAKAMDSADPFTVDFDPRWAKKMPDGSFARQRYLKHIVDQALRVVETQRIGVLFATPPTLESLAGQVSQEKRRRVRGIHFGGLPVSSELRARLADLFPNAVMLSGYGNTLFGMMPELAYDPKTGIDYFPHGARPVVRVVKTGDAGCGQRGLCPVPYGERGQVLVHRLDETQFIANMLERDSAVRIPPRPDAVSDGFLLDGLRDPQPIVNEVTKPSLGLY